MVLQKGTANAAAFLEENLVSSSKPAVQCWRSLRIGWEPSLARGLCQRVWEPSTAAIWMAEGRIEPGVHAPEAVLESGPFFKELEWREIFTKFAVSHML